MGVTHERIHSRHDMMVAHVLPSPPSCITHFHPASLQACSEVCSENGLAADVLVAADHLEGPVRLEELAEVTDQCRGIGRQRWRAVLEILHQA